MEEKRGKAREPGMPQEDMGPCVDGLPAGAEMAGSTADSQERREPELQRGGSGEPGLGGATRGAHASGASSGHGPPGTPVPEERLHFSWGFFRASQPLLSAPPEVPPGPRLYPAGSGPCWP